MTFCSELRALAQEATTAMAAADALIERHPEWSPPWVSNSVKHTLNTWCRQRTCEKHQQRGQPTVFQMRKP